MQRHELNTREEMLKRFIYVLYVGCLFFGFLFVLMALFTWEGDVIVAATLLSIAAAGLRFIGVRYLEFPRLGESFPMGSPNDAVSKETRDRFRALIDAFHDNGSWADRQSIRRRMASLVKQHPPLLDAFGSEIAEVHPNLYYDTNFNQD